MHGWTGFLDACVHLGDGTTRMKDPTTSLVALLVSEACNIGLIPVINPGHKALTRALLVHVDQFYLRADTIAAVNAALIAAQSEVPIVQYWGDGLLASVDGLRFAIPVRTVNAAPGPSASDSSAASPGSTPSTTRSRASGGTRRQRGRWGGVNAQAAPLVLGGSAA